MCRASLTSAGSIWSMLFACVVVLIACVWKNLRALVSLGSHPFMLGFCLALNLILVMFVGMVSLALIRQRSDSCNNSLCGSCMISGSSV